MTVPEYTDDELAELAKLEAEEAGTPWVSPFDHAAAAAAPEEPVSSEHDQLPFGEVRPPKKKKGRPRKEGAKPRRHNPGQAERARLKAAREGAHHVKGPPPPTQPGAVPGATTAVVGPIPAAQLVPLVQRLDSLISARAGTEPLSRDEADQGAQVLAPLLHHYLPNIINSNQPWVPAAMWVAMTYLPRALDRMDAQERARVKRARDLAAAIEAQPAASASTFRDASSTVIPPSDTTVPAADATAPLWRNELDDQPLAPATRQF